MVPDPQPHTNVDQLEATIAEKRAKLAELPTEAERSRRARALDHMAAYVALLREAADAPFGRDRRTPPAVGYTFKVEFADGRWNVEEKELDATPRIGDVVSLGNGNQWRISSSLLVRPRPAGKPPRELFVCAPAI